MKLMRTTILDIVRVGWLWGASSRSGKEQETVKTVFRSRPASDKPLKRCVNEIGVGGRPGGLPAQDAARSLSASRRLFFVRVVYTALVASLLALAPKAQASTNTLSLKGVQGFPGETVSVPLTLSVRPTNWVATAVALQADVLFRPDNLTSADALLGQALGSQVLVSGPAGSGVRRVLIYSLNNSL